MADFIPGADPDFDTWQTNFATYLAANKTALGLEDADVTSITSAETAWDGSYATHVAADVAAQAAKQTKKGGRTAYEAAQSSLIQHLQVSTTVNDALRQTFGFLVLIESPDRNGVLVRQTLASRLKVAPQGEKSPISRHSNGDMLNMCVNIDCKRDFSHKQRRICDQNRHVRL
jgi:hypothetical protein